MSDDSADDSSKTEDPTPKRLEEARKKGQVAMSREANSWLMLLAGTGLIMALSGTVMIQMTQFLRMYIEQAGTMPGAPGGMKFILSGAAMETAKILLMPMLLLMAAAFLGPFLQVGPLWAPSILSIDFNKLSPAAGFGRLFSMRSVLEFAKGLLKITLISAVGFVLVKPYLSGIEHMVGLPIPEILDEMKMLVVRMMAGILIVYLVIAIIDIVYQRMEFTKKMRMTKQELKEEYRQTEGDPMVKQKLRQLRAQKARQRMMQNVPKADVVITNPTHFAIALQYDPEKMDAPICLAKGVDAIALKIRELARESKVTIYENPPLARALYDTVEVDEIIPAEHYKAVAQIISFVFKQKGKLNS
jgi:flagellar biosynthetic protein FlhB